jgi:hypothetical protein
MNLLIKAMNGKTYNTRTQTCQRFSIQDLKVDQQVIIPQRTMTTNEKLLSSLNSTNTNEKLEAIDWQQVVQDSGSITMLRGRSLLNDRRFGKEPPRGCVPKASGHRARPSSPLAEGRPLKVRLPATAKALPLGFQPIPNQI